MASAISSGMIVRVIMISVSDSESEGKGLERTGLMLRTERKWGYKKVWECLGSTDMMTVLRELGKGAGLSLVYYIGPE